MSVRRLVLASQSPRRRQILTISGYDFDILPSQISEIPDENLNLTSQIRQLAADKAEACLKMGKYAPGQGILVLASDTVVVLRDQILGKPKDEKEARSFLRRLSGSTHDVITAVSLIDVETGRRLQDHAITRVTFRKLSDEQIDAYVATGDPLDKAGAYGIQSALASDFIESFEGDYDTVVGLSMAVVEKSFAALGVSPEKRDSFSIAENIKRIRAEIAQAALEPDRATFKGYSNLPARLVAVSKTKPAMDVIDAWLAGQRIFAENYAQEALPKIEEVAELIRLATRSTIRGETTSAEKLKNVTSEGDTAIEWHFIGSLQSKKVKQVVGHFALIHSVDRVSLVEEIEKRAAAYAAELSSFHRNSEKFRQRVLLQINIADETSKGGATRDDFFRLFEAAVRCPHVRVCGVMALPPLTDDAALAKARFADVRTIFEEARERLPNEPTVNSYTVRADFTELSMGTTHDFTIAIGEGATLVRIGTAIFGERN